MVSQYVWIGIIVAAFVAGIAIGYAVFISASQPEIGSRNQHMFNNMMQQNP